ncbi:hypothetical protein [Flavobacterium aquatile]|nr:hypothetical protein [Flavobacterium aquatile]OXA68583.1 hypothetical protein B0A61_02410 [Flavobacterium aquatile LMG 4008 = ATCC 11947]GEC79464.1 hypothetical protein FAQ01_23340 [Flavobacterium aquatile]
MNTNQEVFFSMTLKVKNFAAKNPTVITPIPGVTAQITQLNTLINNLIAADTSSRSDLTGYTITKANRRAALEQLCLKFSNAIAAYAANTGDLVLQKRADFATSFWIRATDDELITNANILKNLATPITAALATYLVTAADVTAFGVAITAYTDGVSDPTLAIDQRKVDNERIPQIIDQIRTLFDTKLDVFMRILEFSNPSMYQLYMLARALDVRGVVVAPTAEVDVAAGVTTTVHTADYYVANTLYSIQNLGDEDVFFSLSSETNVEGTAPVLLSNGETRVRLAENLANAGTFLVVNNPSMATVKVKVWVE